MLFQGCAGLGALKGAQTRQCLSTTIWLVLEFFNADVLLSGLLDFSIVLELFRIGVLLPGLLDFSADRKGLILRSCEKGYLADVVPLC